MRLRTRHQRSARLRWSTAPGSPGRAGGSAKSRPLPLEMLDLRGRLQHPQIVRQRRDSLVGVPFLTAVVRLGVARTGPPHHNHSGSSGRRSCLLRALACRMSPGIGVHVALALFRRDSLVGREHVTALPSERCPELRHHGAPTGSCAAGSPPPWRTPRRDGTRASRIARSPTRGTRLRSTSGSTRRHPFAERSTARGPSAEEGLRPDRRAPGPLTVEPSARC